MITYHVSYKITDTDYDCVTLKRGTTLKQAVRLTQNLPDSRLLWTVDSASELIRQLHHGSFWLKKCWHFEDIPKSEHKSFAIRQWRKRVQLG